MPNGMKRAFTGVALVLICYSLLGFLILPGIAQRIANQQLAAYATVPASLQRIEFNPFSLELSLFGLRIGEQDDRQLAFERLFLDLQWDSLWQRTLHLANVETLLHIIDYHNQFHFTENGKLHTWLQSLVGEITPEQILDFKKTQTLWGTKRPDDVDRRFRNIQHIYYREMQR